MDDNELMAERDDEPDYRQPADINVSELREALGRLQLLGDDPFLRMQVFNLAIVDHFITRLEYDILKKHTEEERTPIEEAAFLSAQSQMWIFAAYEIMRTWRQRGRRMIEWAKNGALESKLLIFEKEVGYLHVGRQFRAMQIKKVLADSSIIERIRDDLKRTHMLFAQMSAIRISIAKHEVKGHKDSVALRPGYGRINQWCGSLDYELENGAYSMGYVSRRDIADGIRALSSDDKPPTDEMIAEFDAYRRGPRTGP
jgi:hypothetical protein